MGCFVACLAEGALVHVAKKYYEKKKGKDNRTVLRLSNLSTLLLGGAFLLIIEHIWHGEVVGYFPFFTALQETDGLSTLLNEILITGGSMDLFLTLTWGLFYICVDIFENKEVHV